MGLDRHLIEGVIWDLDNTLYRFTDEFYRSCTEAAATAAQDLGINLSYEDTLRLAERSENEHGYSMHGYITDHGLSYASLHFPFHKKIDETVIAPILGMKEMLESHGLPQIILTNASRCWAKRVLRHIGIYHLFESGGIIPMEDVGFKPKAKTSKGFKRAAELLDIDVENLLMVDDLDRNLIIPNDMGMQTAYVHHGDPMEELPDFVDQQFKCAMDVGRFLKG